MSTQKKSLLRINDKLHHRHRRRYHLIYQNMLPVREVGVSGGHCSLLSNLSCPFSGAVWGTIYSENLAGGIIHGTKTLLSPPHSGRKGVVHTQPTSNTPLTFTSQTAVHTFDSSGVTCWMQVLLRPEGKTHKRQ